MQFVKNKEALTRHHFYYKILHYIELVHSFTYLTCLYYAEFSIRRAKNIQLVITGRNEVLAKVIFLHLSFIHSVHSGGGGECLTRQVPPRDQAGTPPGADTPRTRQVPPRSRHPPQTRQVPPRPGRYPPRPDTPPRKQQRPEYGQRSAGTHPTGMHSCYINTSI